MKYRHEWKHAITCGDLLVLRQRLSAVMKPDAYGTDGRYLVRSLYFDTASDRALREKIDGVDRREKFRIRYYNHDTSRLYLEKKSKVNGLCVKERTALTFAQTRAILHGELAWMPEQTAPLLPELYSKIMWQGLRPKTIVDYQREAFVYAAGNVRVTLDYHIRTGLQCTDFLNPACVTIPAGEAPIILEVKWDAFLPDFIRDALQLPNCRVGAFSKYALCRIYG